MAQQLVFRLGALTLAVLAASTVRLSAAEKADVAALKQWLKRAGNVPTGDGKTEHEAFRRKLDEAADAVPDPDLRKKAQSLLPELEKAAILSARTRRILADVTAYGGAGKTEPGGPSWLRKLVGDESMHIFARLTELTAVDRSIPIKSGRLNEKVTDDWLQRLVGLPDLRRLDLQAAVVQGPGLKHVGTLKSLESLNLTLLRISDEPLAHLAGLTNLRVLGLASTKVTGTGCKHCAGMTNLVNLNLHYTPVNDAGMEQIGKLASLERLEIVHTHFTDEGGRRLAGLKNLKRLQLGSRDATGKALSALSSLKKLEELDVHDGQASPEGVKIIGGLSGLRVLRISGGSLGGGSFTPLAGLTRLETLVLIHNQVTDAGLETLEGLSQVRRLALEEPKVTPRGLARLRKALPKLEIVKP